MLLNPDFAVGCKILMSAALSISRQQNTTPQNTKPERIYTFWLVVLDWILDRDNTPWILDLDNTIGYWMTLLIWFV